MLGNILPLIPQGLIQIRLNCPQETLQRLFDEIEIFLSTINLSLIGRKLLEVSVEKDVRRCRHTVDLRVALYEFTGFCFRAYRPTRSRVPGYTTPS